MRDSDHFLVETRREADGLRPIYEAARRFVDWVLRSDGSLFTPEHPIWSPPVIDDLHARFVGNPDEGSDHFLTKLSRQLQGARKETIQLAGELLYVHLLIASDTGGPRKRTVISSVLAWAPTPITIPASLDRALDRGLANTGTHFRTRRDVQLRFLLEFIREWKRKTPAEREALLADPWQFKAWLFALPDYSASTQREALLHLIFPKTFEPIV